MTLSPTTKRIAAALSLALFAASIQPIRMAVLDWIDTVVALPN